MIARSRERSQQQRSLNQQNLPMPNPDSGDAVLRPQAIVIWAMKTPTLWTFCVLLLLILSFSVFTVGFFSKSGWTAISVAVTQLLLLAIGETFVIIAGGIDLSVGGVLGLSGMGSAWIMSQLLEKNTQPAITIAIGVMVAIVIGAVFGLLNAFVITRLSLTPLIVTLGTMSVAQGVTQLMNHGQEISELPPQLAHIGNKMILQGWIAVPAAVALAATIIAWIVLSRTRFGRRTRAIGSNTEAALRTGINTRTHLTAIYLICGMFAGIAGVTATAQLGVATVSAGTGDELNAIVAVILGGASLHGGRGSIGGTVVGALIVAVLDTGLIVAKVNSAWQLIAVGTILIFALIADRQRLRFARIS